MTSEQARQIADELAKVMGSAGSGDGGRWMNGKAVLGVVATLCVLLGYVFSAGSRNAELVTKDALYLQERSIDQRFDEIEKIIPDIYARLSSIARAVGVADE